jgi:2'-5' RNA ligase
MEQLRLFVAVELPPEVREALAGLQEGSRHQCGPGVRWTRPEGVHLTLKFLGEVAQTQVAPIEEALAKAARGQAAFKLSLGSTGFFPNPRRPRVLWVGIEGETERLKALARRVEEELSPLGFPTEGRPFTPHLTLARLGERLGPAQREAIGSVVQSAPWRPGRPFAVDGLSLMRSRLDPAGAVYTCLQWAPLATTAPK